jgi:small subunit ribosomal protein S4
MGFARTRRQARQFVSHRHVIVNDRIVNVPSYEVTPDDIVGVRPKSRNLEVIQENVDRINRTYTWLEVDREKMKGRFIELPEREEIPENIDEQLIVELYSK